MSKQNKTHGVQLLVQAIVRDPEGNIVTDTGQNPAHSFTIQFLKFIGAMLHGANDVTATDITNSATLLYKKTFNTIQQFNIGAVVNEDTYGIVVGTDNTAEDNLDYKLGAQIAEGTGVGELTHGEVTYTVAAEVGPNVDLRIVRTFTNATGLDVTVEEAGVYASHALTNYHCIIRDVLPAPVVVPHRYSLSIIYTLRTTI